MTTIRFKTATVQNWVDRRRRKRKSYSADEIREKIATSWPNMKPEEQEEIYQGVK
jgi:hypothetical protein